MSIVSLASGASLWRGYEYHKQNKILKYTKLTDDEYDGIALGSNGEKYDVHIDIKHPRKSKCTCPHANGKRIVCKHQVALFFTAFPEEAEHYYREVVEYEERLEREAEEREAKLLKYVYSLSKDDLRSELLCLIDELPKWIRERYLNEHMI